MISDISVALILDATPTPQALIGNQKTAKIAEGAAMAVGAAAAFVLAPYLAHVILTNITLVATVFGIGAMGAAVIFGGIQDRFAAIRRSVCHRDSLLAAVSI